MTLIISHSHYVKIIQANLNWLAFFFIYKTLILKARKINVKLAHRCQMLSEFLKRLSRRSQVSYNHLTQIRAQKR